MGIAGVSPTMGAVMELPAILYNSARFRTIHTKLIKEVLKEELKYHHKKRIPNHFKLDAKHKYAHKKRADITNLKKQWQGAPPVDLVKSGKTYNKMTRTIHRLRVGGSFDGGGKTKGVKGISATMVLRFAFPTARDESSPQAVTVEQMATEIETFTAAEVAEVYAGFKKRYVAGFMSSKSIGPTMRKRMGQPGY